MEAPATVPARRDPGRILESELVRIDVLGTPAVASEAGVVSGSRLGGRRAQVALVALALERLAVPSPTSRRPRQSSSSN
jgi:hypothetical protein